MSLPRSRSMRESSQVRYAAARRGSPAGCPARRAPSRESCGRARRLLDRGKLIGLDQYVLEPRVIHQTSLPGEVSTGGRVPLIRVTRNKGDKVRRKSFGDSRYLFCCLLSESCNMGMECILRLLTYWILIHARDEIQCCKVRGELLRQVSQAIAIQRSSVPYGECPIDLLVVRRIDPIIAQVMHEVILR